VQVLAVGLEVQDGVAHDLSRAMVGDVTTPVDFVKGGFLFLKKCVIRKEVVFVPAFSQGVNMRVLAKNQVVVGFYLLIFR